ncbi:uncharacterized protein stops [Anabrus simplex]|uniref:uncharacterized protein stops n=1 Tax=Anabrus simplex TaxID=316456 RepID=UPI0035A38FD4
MESFLDCYFDDIFSKLERDCLLARYRRRQLVDYLNTLIMGCCRGEGCSVQLGCARAVMAALRYHASCMHNNGEVCMMGKYHNVLYVAAKLCFDWKLENRSIVCEVLQNMFRCERTLERLMIGAILGPHVTHVLSGWKSDYDSQKQNCLALEYFLEHAAGERLLFDCGTPTRLADVPMSSYCYTTPLRLALQLGQPDTALLLLRYGARAAQNTPVPVVIGNGQEITCLRYLLRGVPMAAVLPHPQKRKKQVGLWRDIIYYDEDSHVASFIPESRRGNQPPQLKHLCRCVLRKTLLENWQLPGGIADLPLPVSLQKYLDLVED